MSAPEQDLEPAQFAAMELGARTFSACIPLVKSRAGASADPEHFYIGFLSAAVGAVIGHCGTTAADDILANLRAMVERTAAEDKQKAH